MCVCRVMCQFHHPPRAQPPAEALWCPWPPQPQTLPPHHPHPALGLLETPLRRPLLCQHQDLQVVPVTVVQILHHHPVMQAVAVATERLHLPQHLMTHQTSCHKAGPTHPLPALAPTHTLVLDFLVLFLPQPPPLPPPLPLPLLLTLPPPLSTPRTVLQSLLPALLIGPPIAVQHPVQNLVQASTTVPAALTVPAQFIPPPHLTPPLPAPHTLPTLRTVPAPHTALAQLPVPPLPIHPALPQAPATPQVLPPAPAPALARGSRLSKDIKSGLTTENVAIAAVYRQCTDNVII